MDLQSLFPIYLPKARTDDQSKEDYDTQITQNENVLNQNLNILFNGIRDLADAVDHIEVGGGSTETIVQTVVQPGGGGDYTLPPATATTLGGVIVGSNLSVTNRGVISVVTADNVEQDNTKPITSAAVYTTVGNINALLELI